MCEQPESEKRTTVNRNGGAWRLIITKKPFKCVVGKHAMKPGTLAYVPIDGDTSVRMCADCAESVCEPNPFPTAKK